MMAPATDDVDSLKGEISPGGCTGSASAKCGELSDAVDSHEQNRNVANITLAVAGVGAAATAGYVLYALLQPEGETPVRATVSFDGSSGGLFLNGSF